MRRKRNLFSLPSKINQAISRPQVKIPNASSKDCLSRHPRSESQPAQASRRWVFSCLPLWLSLQFGTKSRQSEPPPAHVPNALAFGSRAAFGTFVGPSPFCGLPPLLYRSEFLFTASFVF